MKNTLLKVVGILMIIGGALALLLEIIALVGVGALMAASPESISVLGLIAVILLLVSGIVELIAGIKGVSGSKDPAKGAKCLPWGIVIIALQILGQILSIANGSSFDFTSAIIGLVLPVLYIIGSLNAKKALTSGNAQ